MSVSPQPGQPITGDWFTLIGDSIASLQGRFEGDSKDNYGLNEIEVLINRSVQDQDAITGRRNQTLKIELGAIIFDNFNSTRTAASERVRFQSGYTSRPYIFLQPYMKSDDPAYVENRQLTSVVRDATSTEFVANLFLTRDGSDGIFTKNARVRCMWFAVGWKDN